MRLAELAAVLPDYLWKEGEPGDAVVSGISYDSRRVAPGHLFVCWRGQRHDGHQFAREAVDRGAAALLVERRLPDIDVPQIVVSDAREAMAYAAAQFHRWPSRRLQLIGVTGTNGKTTTTHLIKAVLEAAGHRVGLIGTIQYDVGGRTWEARHTTPESADLQALLAHMAADGITHCVMEVSSHAIALKRIAACHFAVGVFTNLTQDHLDFHGTLDGYAHVKAEFFRSLSPKGHGAVAIVNADDPWSAEMAAASRVPVWRYGVDSEAVDFAAHRVHVAPDGVRYEVRTPGGTFPVRLQLTGRFNVYNSLAAVAVGHWAGVDPATIQRGLEGVRGVPGRFERVDAGQPFTVLVDYAHTPDSLENVLRAARQFTHNKLWVVFGCGGDRDRAKRPLMGGVAARLADRVIITSDNPRSEDPEAICAEVAAGAYRARAEGEAQSDVAVIVDRRQAIAEAIMGAEAGDLVLVAGKGHETEQIFRDRTVHFDDREEAAAAIRRRLQHDGFRSR